jgi:hypothetical protein
VRGYPRWKKPYDYRRFAGSRNKGARFGVHGFEKKDSLVRAGEKAHPRMTPRMLVEPTGIKNMGSVAWGGIWLLPLPAVPLKFTAKPSSLPIPPASTDHID